MAEVMRCEDAETQLAAHAMGQLERDGVDRLEEHLRGCVDCRRAGAGYLAGAAAMAVALPAVTPPPRLRTKILATVYAEASGGRSEVKRPVIWQRIWAQFPAGRAWTLGGVLTSLTIGAVALVSATQRAAPITPATAATMVVDVKGSIGGARGSMVYQPSSQIGVMSVQGLPTLAAAGSSQPVYEVWLERSDRTNVAAAYLTLQPDGQTWMAPIHDTMGGYINVMVTMEPHTGDITPQGDVVARGTIG